MRGECPRCGVGVVDVDADTTKVVGGKGIFEWHECHVCGATSRRSEWTRDLAPADERGEPYYIDSDCQDCGTPLVLFDEHHDCEEPWWYDEWWCTECEEGIVMDWPRWKRKQFRKL